MIAAIVAVDNNWGIGYDGELLERIPEDMKHFRELTEGNYVLMGRKTWESIGEEPLPLRQNIVVSTTKHENIINTPLTEKYPTWFIHPIHAKCFLDNMGHFFRDDNGPPYTPNFFIIGGAQTYQEFLPYCDTVYLTHIGKDHKNVDTYFPRIDKDPEWEIDTCTKLRESITGIPYAFLTYKRV